MNSPRLPTGRLERLLVATCDQETIGQLERIFTGWSCRMVVEGEARCIRGHVDTGEFDLLFVDSGLPGLDARSFDTDLQKAGAIGRGRIVYLADIDSVSRETRVFLRQTDRPVVPKPISRFDLESSIYLAAGALRDV